MELFVTEGYPMEAPKARFLTRVYHPNIDKLGRICLSTLKAEHWSPALQLSAVLLSIQALLSVPNPDGIFFKLFVDILFHFAFDSILIFLCRSS